MSGFFGFDTSMAPLEEFPEEVEEEYDVLNDETFGSGAVEEWQADNGNKLVKKNEPHVQKVPQVQNEPQVPKVPQVQNEPQVPKVPQVQNEPQHVQKVPQSKTSPNDSGFASAEQLQFQEDELEQSITQLVLDEELDDPAIMSSTKSNSSSAFFRSSSPAAPFGEDLLSPATNIWWPPTHGPTKEDELKAILGIGRGSVHPSIQDSAILSAVPSQKRMVTAEELEKDLRSRAPPPRSISPVIGSPPASSMMPIGTPPRHHIMPKPMPSTPAQTPPQQILPSPMQPSLLHQLTQEVLQKTGGNGSPQQISQIVQNMYSNSGRVSPNHITNIILAGLARHQMSPMQGFSRPPFQQYQHGRIPSSPMSMPNIGRHQQVYGGGMMGNQHQQTPYRQYGGSYGDGYNRNYTNQQHFRSPNPQFNRNSRQFRNNRNDERGYHNSPNTHNGVRDEYANLMTPKEKEWILKIQMLQLQTEDPMVEDFYYQMFIRKKMAKEKEKEQEQRLEGIQSELNTKEKTTKVLLPPPKLEIREYKPMQFAGALGKLTAVSVNSPRKIIDIEMGNSIDEEEESKVKTAIHSNKQQKALLTKIEKLYILMLSLIDLQRQLAEVRADTDSENLQGKRKTLQDKLFSGLHIEQQLLDRPTDDHFTTILAVRKGRKLVGRSLDVLNAVQAQFAVQAILRNLSTLIKRGLQDVKKETHEETLPAMYLPVVRVIQSTDLSQLTSLVSCLTSDIEGVTKVTARICVALQNKFGSSVIMCLVNQAEAIFSKTSLVDIDNETQEAWTEQVTDLATAICAIDAAISPAPFQDSPNVLKHFGRFVSKQSYIALDRRLGTVANLKS